MWSTIRRWLSGDKPAATAENPPPRSITPDQVEHEDEFARRCIAECFRTGKTVIGTRREDGSEEMTVS